MVSGLRTMTCASLACALGAAGGSEGSPELIADGGRHRRSDRRRCHRHLAASRCRCPAPSSCHQEHCPTSCAAQPATIQSSATLPPTAALRRDPKSNPDGWIPLVVAENKLNNAEVLARLQEGSKDAPEWVMNYGRCAADRAAGGAAAAAERRGHPLRLWLPRLLLLLHCSAAAAWRPLLHCWSQASGYHRTAIGPGLQHEGCAGAAGRHGSPAGALCGTRLQLRPQQAVHLIG